MKIQLSFWDYIALISCADHADLRDLEDEIKQAEFAPAEQVVLDAEVRARYCGLNALALAGQKTRW
jgi:hypothetical protein